MMSVKVSNPKLVKSSWGPSELSLILTKIVQICANTFFNIFLLQLLEVITQFLSNLFMLFYPKVDERS